jgi:hypothetical protein
MAAKEQPPPLSTVLQLQHTSTTWAHRHFFQPIERRYYVHGTRRLPLDRCVGSD